MTTYEFPRPQDEVLILKRIPVFSTCSEDQLHFIAERTRLVEYKKGELVYREGDTANAFYMISSGRLRVFSMEGARKNTRGPSQWRLLRRDFAADRRATLGHRPSRQRHARAATGEKRF